MIYNHITNCKGVSYLVELLNINNISVEREKIVRKIFSVNILRKTLVSLIKPNNGTFYFLKKRWRLKTNVQHLTVVSKCPDNEIKNISKYKFILTNLYTLFLFEYQIPKCTCSEPHFHYFCWSCQMAKVFKRGNTHYKWKACCVEIIIGTKSIHH